MLIPKVFCYQKTKCLNLAKVAVVLIFQKDFTLIMTTITKHLRSKKKSSSSSLQTTSLGFHQKQIIRELAGELTPDKGLCHWIILRPWPTRNWAIKNFMEEVAKNCKDLLWKGTVWPGKNKSKHSGFIKGVRAFFAALSFSISKWNMQEYYYPRTLSDMWKH